MRTRDIPTQTPHFFKDCSNNYWVGVDEHQKLFGGLSDVENKFAVLLTAAKINEEKTTTTTTAWRVTPVLNPTNPQRTMGHAQTSKQSHKHAYEHVYTSEYVERGARQCFFFC